MTNQQHKRYESYLNHKALEGALKIIHYILLKRNVLFVLLVVGGWGEYNKNEISLNVNIDTAYLLIYFQVDLNDVQQKGSTSRTMAAISLGFIVIGNYDFFKIYLLPNKIKLISSFLSL